MPRKSPRSRRRRNATPRLPGSNRPRATPGRRAARKRTVARAGHAPRGGARPAGRKTSATRRAKTVRRATAVRRPVRVRATAATPRPAAAPRARFTPPDPARVASILLVLEGLYPAPTTALDHESPLQLLIATILSAQCTDERVNKVTPALFARWPDAAALAAAPLPELEAMIHSTGFFRNKAKSIHACCADIVAKHGGQVPDTLEALTALHGVGRKTANVVLGNAFGVPGLVVDTHVQRLSGRLGLTREKDAVKVEFALMPIVPRVRWTAFSHWLILHGRQVCNARKPRCSACTLAPHCPRLGVTASQ